MERADLEREFERTFTCVNDNYRSLCPFHDERTPSFLVHQTDLVGHCFGCNTGGSIDFLLARYRGCTIEEAKRALGISATEYFARSKARKKEKEPIKYYPESWLAPWKKEVHKYVIDRGFSRDTIKDAGALWDPVAKREVFPVRDRVGRLLGCTGRACDGREPKWYHYWGWDKGKALYQPFKVDPLRPIIVVEGVFDVLWLYQNGVDNVVATLGAGATREQINLLLELGSRFILGFDNDGAGRGGSQRFHRDASSTLRLQFIEWPLGTHDWLDLNRKQIESILDHSVSYVSRAIIRHSNTSSEKALRKEEDAARLGAGDRKDSDSSSGSGEAVRAWKSPVDFNPSACQPSASMGRKN